MAHKQFHIFQRIISSFEAVEAFNGIFKPGRYCGFDSQGSNAGGAGLSFKVNHDLTGITKLDKNNIAENIKRGVVVTNQGCILHLEPLVLENYLVNNTANTRYDLLICRHKYAENVNGSPISFETQYGTPGAGIPTMTQSSDVTRVLMAVIKIPANTTTWSNQIEVTPVGPIINQGVKGVLDVSLMANQSSVETFIPPKEINYVYYVRYYSGNENINDSFVLPNIGYKSGDEDIIFDMSLQISTNVTWNVTFKRHDGTTIQTIDMSQFASANNSTYGTRVMYKLFRNSTTWRIVRLGDYGLGDKVRPGMVKMATDLEATVSDSQNSVFLNPYQTNQNYIKRFGQVLSISGNNLNPLVSILGAAEITHIRVSDHTLQSGNTLTISLPTPSRVLFGTTITFEALYGVGADTINFIDGGGNDIYLGVKPGKRDLYQRKEFKCIYNQSVGYRWVAIDEHAEVYPVLTIDKYKALPDEALMTKGFFTNVLKANAGDMVEGTNPDKWVTPLGVKQAMANSFSGIKMMKKDMPAWDMDTVQYIMPSFPDVPRDKIIGVKAYIRNNAQFYSKMDLSDDGRAFYHNFAGEDVIYCERNTGGRYDDASFGGTSISRGHFLIFYME